MKRVGLVFVFALAVFFTALAFKIQSYVTAQDPSQIYIPQAWSLIRSDWSLDALKSITADLSPAWAIFLALVIEGFGRYAPYWVNVCFLTGFYALLTCLVRKSLIHEWRALAVVMISVAITLGAYELNPHFLLYPFRDLPSVFFLLLAYFGAWNGKRPLHLLLAGAALTGAIAIREVALVGVLGFAIISTIRGWRKTWWLYLPLVVLGGLGLALMGGMPVQAKRYLAKALGQDAAAPGFAPGFANLGLLLRSISVQLTPLAFVFFGLGIWRGRRRPFLLALVGTGCAYAVVYSLYEWHPRYVMTTLIWVAPVMAYGLVGPADQKWPGASRWLFALTGMILVYIFVHTGHWDGRVTRSEVKAFRTVMKQHVGKGGIVGVDPACRIARGAVECFSHADRTSWTTEPFDFSGAHYIEALDPAAWHPNAPEYYAAPLSELARQYYDLVPVPGGSFTLNQRPYRLLRLEKFAHREVVDRVQLVAGRDALLWLDLRSAHAQTAELKRVGGGVVKRWEALEPRCIEVLHVPGDLVDGTDYRLTVRSDGPLPTDVVFARTGVRELFQFDFQRERRLSTEEWFGAGFRIHDKRFRYHVALMPGTGELHLPVKPLPGAKKVYVDLFWYGRPTHAGTARFDARAGGVTLASQQVDLSQIQVQQRFEVPIAAAKDLQLELSGVDNPEYLLYLMRLKFKYVYD